MNQPVALRVFVSPEPRYLSMAPKMMAVARRIAGMIASPNDLSDHASGSPPIFQWVGIWSGAAG